MESDFTVGQAVSTAPLAVAVVLRELADVLGTGSSVPIHIPQEINEGVGLGVDDSYDGVIGAQDIPVTNLGNLCGAVAESLPTRENIARVYPVIVDLQVLKYLFIDSELFGLFHNSYLHNITVVALGHGETLVFTQ